MIGGGRRVVEAARRFPQARWARVDLATLSADDWAVLLEGIEAVVNCAGALQDSPRDRLRAAHVDGVRALAYGARTAGVGRLIHISAAGAADLPGAFGISTRDAETAIQSAGIDWIVLRPGLVLAPAAFGGSALLRGLAAFPIAIPAVHAGSLIQVTSVNDISAAVAAALQPAAPVNLTIDLVAARALPVAEILLALRAWMGLATAPVISLAPIAGRLAAGGADALAWLGWRGPMRSASLEQLRHGVRGDAAEAARHLGIVCGSLDEMLAAEPSGAQERWFARLYFLRPVTLAVLASFWIMSGLIGMLEAPRAVQTLTVAGIAARPAQALVWLGSVLDISLGALICHRATARWALRGTLWLSGAYVLGATVWRADLWSDPLGPLLKIIPAALLACVALAILDER